MNKKEILFWANEYDKQFSEDVQTERKLGDKLRKTKEVTLEDLIGLNDWKFKGNEPRRKHNLSYIQDNNDANVRNITKQAFLDMKSDQQKIDLFDDNLKGVGTSMASVILTFYNPKEFCVFDIHV